MSSLRRTLSLITTFALTFIALAPLSARPALAQATTGSIRGTVTDPAGGSIVEAAVRARNQATNIETNVRTSGEGLYDISGLIPGNYTVTVEAPGFKRAQVTDVNVNLGQVSTIDVALQAGGVEETVTVVAGTEEVVQRDQAQISATFETRKVEELPSNAAGSGLDTLALLAPGVIPSSGFGGTNTNGTGLSVNGNRPRSNNFQIDGSDNNDLGIGGPSYFVGNQDQVAEFQIITNNFSAQYGRNQGAIVNIVTKSGTNDFHGTGFIYHRDQRALDTLTNIERASGQGEAPRFLSNVFGGTFGGPIVKDRAFFFGSYQGIRQRQEIIFRSSATNTIAILPEELPRLASLYPGNPAIQAVAERSAFALSGPGSVVRRSTQPGFDEVDQICLPNATAGGAPNCFNAAFVERVIQTPFDQDEFSVRGDVKLTDRDSFYVRYLDQRGNNKNLAAFFLTEPTGGFNGDLPAFTRNLGGTYTRQLGSSSVNEFKATWQNFGFDFGGGCSASEPGCIPAPSEIAESFSELIFPAGSITGTNSGATLQQISGGAGLGLPQGRTSEVYQFADTFTTTRGRHTLIAGAEFKYLKNTAPFLPTFQGSFRYTTPARLVSNSAQRLTLAVGQPIIDYTEYDQYYFIQDDWKVRDNLTLNLGLRYEYTGQPINDLADLTEARESNPETAIFNPALPLAARTVPRIPADKNNFAPRFGFAWSPRLGGESALRRFLFGGDDATVIRGGFSVAYDPAFYNILLNVSNTAPTAASLLANNLPASGSGRFGFINNATATNVQAAAAEAGILPIGQLDPRLLNQTIVGSDFHSPYSLQFSLGVQRQLNRNNVFELRYVGTRGRDLFQSLVRNPRIDLLLNGFTVGGVTYPGFPNLVPAGVTPVTCADVAGTPDNEGACNGRIIAGQGRVLSRENTGKSWYDSLQARYNGRLFNDLSLGLAYTFSKTLDTASEIFAYSENSPLPQNPFDPSGLEKSLSALHRPHAFSMNFLYEVPFFREQRGFVGHLLGGFQVNSTYVLTSGRPFTPSQVFNASYLGLVGGGLGAGTYLTDTSESLRPFYGNPNAPATAIGISQLDAARLFGTPVTNPNGFLSANELFQGSGEAVPVTLNDVRYVINGPGAARFFGTPFGNVPRNSERGPRVNQLNLSVFKNTRVGETLTVQFRTEVYNLLNHPNPGYGVAAGTNAIPPIYVDFATGGFNNREEMEFGRRVIQFGLRFIF